jgi:DNA-binding response OmpR family regulator
MPILVVDDDPSVCSCIAAFLRQHGFEVWLAYDGQCALRIAKEQGMYISAVLTDVNMPVINGIDMWDQMRSLVPVHCRVVFMSGLAYQYKLEHRRVPGELLQKPFSFDELLGKLNEDDSQARAAKTGTC